MSPPPPPPLPPPSPEPGSAGGPEASIPLPLLGGHEPVMVAEVLTLLDPQPGETVLDCTAGRGGHAAAMVPRLAPGGRYIGLDADRSNIDALREVAALADNAPAAQVTVDFVHANFADAAEVLGDLGVRQVDGVVADLGFASTQMDEPERGLSFAAEGPLDMRMDREAPVTAAELVNRLPERELADVIYRYGEERASRKIARKIVDARKRKPIKTTRELADICAAAYGPAARRQRIDPATRTFQALRIAVNDELDALARLLEALPAIVRPGGRVVIISFHSLEDRQVKRAFRSWRSAGWAEMLTRKPLTAGAAERATNRRSRSAKCRAVKIVAEGF